MLLIPSQRVQAHLAEHAHEVGEEADRLLEAFVRDDRHARERLEIGLLAKAEPARALSEGGLVDLVVVEEELPRVDVGDVLAVDDQREGDIPKAVGALVGVVLGLTQTLDQSLIDAQVALEAAAQGLFILAVEPGADVLPAGGDQDGAVRVEHGQAYVAGGGEAVAQTLRAAEIDEAGQGMLGGSHSRLSSPRPVSPRVRTRRRRASIPHDALLTLRPGVRTTPGRELGRRRPGPSRRSRRRCYAFTRLLGANSSRNASTTAGSNWRPEFSSSSSIAAAVGSAAR